MIYGEKFMKIMGFWKMCKYCKFFIQTGHCELRIMDGYKVESWCRYFEDKDEKRL